MAGSPPKNLRPDEFPQSPARPSTFGAASTSRSAAVAVSADAMPAQIERARQAGFHAHWSKPLDVAQVQRDVQRLLAASGGTDTTVSGR